MAEPDTHRKTALFALHQDLAAKMVNFAGYAMPLHYQAGMKQEHLHTRKHCGMFDVSHMGQAIISSTTEASLTTLMESLVPTDIQQLPPENAL